MYIKPFFGALSLLALSSPALAEGPSWLDGNWGGAAYQLAAPNTFTMTVQGNSATTTYRIGYPTFKCGGTWKLLSYDNNKAEFREKITRDKNGICAPAGKVVVTRINDNFVTYSYFDLSGTNLEAFSTIQKQ